MHYIFNPIESSMQTLAVADISNKKPYPVIIPINLCHFPLFHLITGVNDEPSRIELCERHWNEGVAKGPSPSCHKNRFIFKHPAYSLYPAAILVAVPTQSFLYASSAHRQS